MIIFYNPYESGESTGATRRISFLSSGLKENNIAHKRILKNDIEKVWWLYALSKLPLVNRALYFFSIYFYALKGYKVISEVIVSPVWNNNVFLTVHDLKAFDIKAKRGKGKKNIYKFFCRLAHAIIAVSEYTKDELIKNCDVSSHKIMVVPNGLSEERVDKLEAKVANPNPEFDFIYVSSFAKHKRHIQLIKALPTKTSLLLIGRDFGELENIKKEVKLREDVGVIIRCDVETDEELINLLKSSKVGVFPSVYEGFGIPLLEYYAARLIVVASDIKPFKELSIFVNYFHAADDQDSLTISLSEALKHSISVPDKSKLQQYTESNVACMLATFLK